MERTNPLEPIEKSQEELYFRKKNQALIERMRARLAREQDVAGMRADTGVEDQALLEHLTELGVTRETVRVLPLVPLLQVAWADGRVHEDERRQLIEAAEEAGVSEGPSREAFDRMLERRPSEDFFNTALDFVRAMLEALSPEQAADARGNLESLARRLAEVNAGVFFGIFGWIPSEQRSALRRIARRLSEQRPEATERMLRRI